MNEFNHSLIHLLINIHLILLNEKRIPTLRWFCVKEQWRDSKR